MIEGSGQNITPNFNGPSQFEIISPASLMHTSCSNLINKCLIDDSRDINWQPLTFGRLAVHPDVTSQGLDHITHGIVSCDGRQPYICLIGSPQKYIGGNFRNYYHMT